jgi:hypothetical protein
MSPKGTQLFGWLEYCIHEDLPLSCVEKPMIRKYCNIKPCCIKTLRQNFLKVGYLTALNIKRDLPSKFGLLFDGWTAPYAREQYCAIYATYMKDGKVMC